MQYKISITAMAVIGLFGVSANSFAFTGAAASAREAEQAVFDQRYTLIDNGVSIIDTVRSAVLGSYVKNSGWPTNTSSLVGGGYLSTISASWGQNVLGTATGGGNSYTLALAAPSAEIAQAIAAKIAGVAAGSSVQVTIPVPALASVNQNSLSRVAVAGHPEVNKMFTDIDMNSFSLGNVNQVDAVIINGTTSTIGALTVNTSLDVVPDAIFRRNVTITGNASVNQFTANAITINGGLEAGTFIRASGDINGKNLIASQDIVAGSQIRASSGAFLGGVAADSAAFKSGTIDSLISNSAIVKDMFISQGNAEFYQNALFKGSVTVNGALSVGGIASALDIREGGVFLKDKYSQLAGINIFTENNSFNKMVALNGGASVDGKTVVSADGKILFEDSVALSSKYLGINDKATSATSADNALNADKLGNVAAALYARHDSDNTFTKSNTFTQSVALNGGVTVDGKQVISADGTTLYENGQALSARYLGVNATAKNSDKLGNVSASSYARKDIVETFNESVNFNKGIHIKSDWVRVDAQNGIYFQSYGGGWHMSDPTFIRAYGGKSIFTSGMIRADSGIQVDNKWVVSSDGTTLYENSVALSDKYLKKSDTAVNADKLGGFNANQYARTNESNVFSVAQTFNGGLSAGGNSTFANVVVSGTLNLGNDLYFKDNKGNSKSLRGLSANVDDLDKWKRACQISMDHIDCGLRSKSGVGNETILFVNSAGLSYGSFTLSQPYSNFDTIEVYGASPSGSLAQVSVWKKSALDFYLGKSIELWNGDYDYWHGRFDSGKRNFTTDGSNGKIYKIVGVNLN